MLHFTCDLCGCPVSEHRYVVELAITPAFDPAELTQADLDADHLEQIAAILAAGEEAVDEAIEEVSPRRYRYDLCEACAARFRKDPLQRSAGRRLHYSEN
jgi:hypothetical protein